jgi:hypothetical protein
MTIITNLVTKPNFEVIWYLTNLTYSELSQSSDDEQSDGPQPSDAAAGPRTFYRNFNILLRSTVNLD